MSIVWRTFRNSMFLMFSIALLSGCDSTPEKVAPVEYYIPETIPPKAYTVEIKEMRFEPAELTLHQGDTVFFVNNDLVTHDITEEKNKAWTSSPLPAGKAWSMVVTQSSDYYCSIHVVMKGRLLVK